MSQKAKQKNKRYKVAVENAYSLLVTFRKCLEEDGKWDYAQEVELAYKELWCECLNAKAPWT